MPQAGSPLEDLAELRRYGRLKPGPSQSKPDVIASQRARLQRAIIDLAAQDGVRAVTVRRLTKLAGVSTAAFYSRFSGTDACLLTTYEEIMAGAARSIVSTRAPDLRPGDQLDRALRVLLERLLIDRAISRFALIEIYEGGPAAIASIGAAERRLVLALRGCVARRGRRVPEVTVTAIVAAVLHCARAELMNSAPGDVSTIADSLVEWATDVVEGREEIGMPLARVPQPATEGPGWVQKRSAYCEHNEEDLIVAAILRLALPDGFRGLDPGKVSSGGRSADRPFSSPLCDSRRRLPCRDTSDIGGLLCRADSPDRSRFGADLDPRRTAQRVAAGRCRSGGGSAHLRAGDRTRRLRTHMPRDPDLRVGARVHRQDGAGHPDRAAACGGTHRGVLGGARARCSIRLSRARYLGQGSAVDLCRLREIQPDKNSFVYSQGRVRAHQRSRRIEWSAATGAARAAA